MAKDALQWLQRLCTLYTKHDHSVYACTAEAHTSGILVRLELDRGNLYLLVQPPQQAGSYASTASMDISIHHPPEAGPLPGNGELVARQFIAVLKRADKGDLLVPTGGGSPVEMRPAPDAQPLPLPETRVEEAQAAQAKATHSEEIHWASFVGYKAIVTQDLYPHVDPLGKIVSEEEILSGWRQTVKRISNGTAPQKLGLYVHSPFCTVACTFCYCAKTDRFDRAMMDAYLEQLHDEISLFAPVFSESTFTSVYFGGGTPSLLSPAALRRLFASLYGAFNVPDGTQIIFEGNPDSLNEQKIEVLAEVGRISRLTIGVQTLDERVQAIVKRFNKPEHVARAVTAARAAGIRHVNCDVMAGMPEQTLESFQQDVEFLIGLDPDSLHLNGYRPLPRTELAQALPEIDDRAVELRDAMLAWGTERLAAAGHSDKMGQGARKTKNAANIQEYNLRRQNSSLLGLGYPARSHSFGAHYYAPEVGSDFDSGLAAELAHKRRWRAVEVDDLEEQHKYLVNNFRTGFSRSEFVSIFGVEAREVAPAAFAKLEAMGVISVVGDQVRSHVATPEEDLTYRTFFYSPKHMARAREVWGPEYDRSMDYRKELLRLTESQG